jgi:hypothetical protein
MITDSYNNIPTAEISECNIFITVNSYTAQQEVFIACPFLSKLDTKCQTKNLGKDF